MFRSLYTYFFGESETHLSLEEARTILNTVTAHNAQETQQTTQTDDTIEANTTFHKIGVVTSRNGCKYVIDDLYNYESDVLEASEGDRVSFISFVSDRKLCVTDVSVIVDSDWDTPVINQKSSWCNRILTVKVIQRNLRVITVEPGSLNIDLNQVHSEFIPLVGDWLQVEAKCDLDETVTDLTGKVLEITKIRPLRLKQTIGVVKRWDINLKTGLIDRDVFFNFDALNCGYSPCIGDKVIAEVIESEQNFCNWRAVKVVPNLIHKNLAGVEIEPKFEKNVNGIEISDGIDLEFQKPQQNQSFTLEISNKTEGDVVLKEIEFFNKNGQCRLEKSYQNTIIQSSSVLKVDCNCISRNYGSNKELLLFIFENCVIGRYITITLQLQETSHNSSRNRYNRPNFASRQQNHRYNNNNRRDYIPGQKTIRNPAFIARRIGQFEIPDKLWSLYLDYSSNSVILSETLLKKKPCLQKLDYHCYEDYFHTLLHLEEIENVLAMRKYDQEKACFIKNGDYLMLEIENLSEKRPSIIQGDKIIACDPFNCKSSEWEGVVHKVGAKHVYLKFSPIFHENYKSEDYSVRIVSSRAQMKRCHHAIGLAIRNLGRELLFPTKVQIKPAQFNLISETTNNRNQMILKKLQEVTKTSSMLALEKSENTATIQKKTTNVKIEWYDKNLNHYQKEAVRNILLAEAKPLPYFIFGPPGTGKTVTLVETILQILTLLPDARILVGTPSNSAADVIATRLIDSCVLKPGDLIRFVAFRCVVDDSIPVKLVPYCATADISAEGSDHTKTHTTLKNGLTLGVNCSVIGRHRVTVSTCSNLGILFNMNFPKGHFTHIMIDEAGHLLEPEAMIPLSFLDVSSGQAILAGDPLQLGPVVLSKIAAEFGLAESYLERLMNRFPYSRDPEGFPKTGGYDPKLVTKLVYNYRSLPDILKIPSKLFYNSELIPTVH